MAILTAVLFGTGPAFRASRAAPIDALRDAARARRAPVPGVSSSFRSRSRWCCSSPRGRSSRPSAGWPRCRSGSTPTASSSSTSILLALTRIGPLVSPTTSSWSNGRGRCPEWRRRPRRRSRRSIRRRSHRCSPTRPGTRAGGLAGVLCHLREDNTRRAGFRPARQRTGSPRRDRQRVVRRPVPGGPGSAGLDARSGPCSPPADPVPSSASSRTRRSARSASVPGPRSIFRWRSPLIWSRRAARRSRSACDPQGRPALLARCGRCAEAGERPAVVLVPAARAGCRRSADAGAAAGRPVVVLWRAGAAAVGPGPLRHDRACRRQRRTEIGIRLALGATPMRVLRIVLLRTLTVTGLGMLGGVAASVWASRFIASLLFGVHPAVQARSPRPA